MTNSNTFNHNVFHAAEEHVINPFKQLHFISGATWCKEEMMKDVQELIEALKRRQKSDDECGHPFDENISTALLNWEKKYGKN